MVLQVHQVVADKYIVRKKSSDSASFLVQLNLLIILKTVHFVDYDGESYKVYRLYGQIFFASTANFANMFNYIEDQDHIIIDFKNAHIWDHSAVVAISKIKQKYLDVGKTVHVVGLNNDSNFIVNKVDDTIFAIDN